LGSHPLTGSGACSVNIGLLEMSLIHSGSSGTPLLSAHGQMQKKLSKIREQLIQI
jgi:hypothetical protein